MADATGDPPRAGLRERKKAKTRALIQERALRLFREQGYEGTSIEEIADAAEVSLSTVFRYFPTKPDLVIYDDLDERMIAAFRAQPAELNAVQGAARLIAVRPRHHRRRGASPATRAWRAHAERARVAGRPCSTSSRDRRERSRALSQSERAGRRTTMPSSPWLAQWWASRSRLGSPASVTIGR